MYDSGYCIAPAIALAWVTGPALAQDSLPFAESEVGGDDHRGALVEPADQVEQQLTAGQGEGQVAEFVEDDEVEAGE